MTAFRRAPEEVRAAIERFAETRMRCDQERDGSLLVDFDAEALFEMVRMLNRRGLTRIHIPAAAEAESL